MSCEVKTIIVQSQESRVKYIKCSSNLPFVMPNEGTKPCAKEVNKSLNLNLGLPINPENRFLRKIFQLMSKVIELVEQYGIMLWIAIPLRYRHAMTMVAWKIFFPIHQKYLGTSTGIHADASDEYHALTSVMWWGNLFPVTLKRIRFALNQIQVMHPPSAVLELPSAKSNVSHDEAIKGFVIPSRAAVTKIYTTEGTKKTLKGYYIQIDETKASENAIFWIYGGAYLGGDCEGNAGIAEKIGKECNSDIFLANYRLLPENEFLEAKNDVIDAYDYFSSNFHYEAKNIKILGISSGGGLSVSLLQYLAESLKNNSGLKMPAGAVLMCPFVDYTDPKGTFKEYHKHDLIVNTSVTEMGVPYLRIKLGSEDNQRKSSPVYGSFEGLPPLCIVISEHECMYDQVIMLVNNARQAGVDCTVGVWKYMCHVFPMLSPFIPEGQQSWDFMCEWIKTH